MMDIDLTVIEKVRIYFVKSWNDFYQIMRFELTFVAFAFYLGKIQNTVDVVWKTIGIIEHVLGIFKLIFSWKFMLEKCFKVKL